MIKDLRDAGQQEDVDIVFCEDTVDVAAVAMELLRKPADGTDLRHCVKHLPDSFSDFHSFLLHSNTKCEPS